MKVQHFVDGQGKNLLCDCFDDLTDTSRSGCVLDQKRAITKYIGGMDRLKTKQLADGILTIARLVDAYVGRNCFGW